jgi:hypothetical protein
MLSCSAQLAASNPSSRGALLPAPWHLPLWRLAQCRRAFYPRVAEFEAGNPVTQKGNALIGRGMTAVETTPNTEAQGSVEAVQGGHSPNFIVA